MSGEPQDRIGDPWLGVVEVLSGERTAVEDAALEELSRNDTVPPEAIERLADVWDALRPEPYSVDRQAGWDLLSARLGATKVPATHNSAHVAPRRTHRQRGTKSFTQKYLGWIAATAAIMMVGMGVLYTLNDGRRVVPDAHRQADAHVYTTNRGQRAQFDLPDGSHVVLGPESRLVYIGGATRGARDVELDGHAYFSVTHHVERPFTVRAGKVVAQVLGTSFTVRAYASDKTLDGVNTKSPQAQIGVTEGKVAIGYEMPETVLMAGDIGRLAPGAPPQVTHNATVMDVLGWTRGHFTLRDVTVREAAIEIARQYDVEVIVPEPALANQVITVVFTGQPAANLVREVAAMLGARAEWQGQRVTLRAGR